MVEPRSARFDTLAIHAGASPDPATGARSVPIHLTTSYVFDDTEHAAGLFDLARAGHIYTRISNPTVAVLETRIAALEGGVAAVATASGQAAIHLAIATLMGIGWSRRSLVGALRRDGQPPEPHTSPIRDRVHARPSPRPRCASIRLPTRDPLAHGRDHRQPGARGRRPVGHGTEGARPRCSASGRQHLCHARAVPARGAWRRPVVHSATKWLAGHGAVIAGLLVDGGTFDWEISGRFPTLTDRYEPYGVVFAEEFGPAAFAMRARAEGLRDFGACMDPVVAWLVLQGIETLTARMERHQRVTAECRRVPRVPTRPSDGSPIPIFQAHPDHEVATRMLPNGAGSMVVIRGEWAGEKPGAASSSPAGWRRTWPTSVMSVPWSSTLPAHPSPDVLRAIGSSRHRRGHGAALRRVWRIPPTSAMTWTGHCAHRRRDDIEVEVNGIPVFASTGGGQFDPHRPPSPCSTARGTTTPSGDSRRERSPPTADRCWRSTCPATAGQEASSSTGWRPLPNGC